MYYRHSQNQKYLLTTTFPKIEVFGERKGDKLVSRTFHNQFTPNPLIESGTAVQEL